MGEGENLLQTRTQSGFTLIEILVVLVIVAIVIAITVISFGDMGRGRRERMAVEQLVRVIGAAQQQAILTPAVLGLGFHSEGYQFYQYQFPGKSHPGAWKPLRDDVFSNVTAFHDLFIARLAHVAGFEETTKSHASQPIITFSPGGSVVPFVLTLQGEKLLYTLSVQDNGVATVAHRVITHD